VKRTTFPTDDPAEGKFSIKAVVADKGHDAEHDRKEIRERMKANAFIPLRRIEPIRMNGTRVRTGGFCRRRVRSSSTEKRTAEDRRSRR
jgi:hypothetical protein